VAGAAQVHQLDLALQLPGRRHAVTAVAGHAGGRGVAGDGTAGQGLLAGGDAVDVGPGQGGDRVVARRAPLGDT
jgi:hypothetical protein